MKLDEIYVEWDKDSKIDTTDLGNESIKIPQLHNKYFKVYTSEKLLLRKFEAEMRELKLEKYEFYTQGPTKETQEKGWDLPAKGLILKSDIPMYMDGDKQLIELSLKIGYQQEKIELLESIIKSLVNRGFQIKSAIDWHKFTMGA